jgi:hypothetical protein
MAATRKSGRPEASWRPDSAVASGQRVQDERWPGGRALGAVVAGWLFPGLGHVLLGQARRGIVFALLILGSFGLGLAHDGRLALRDPESPVLTTLQLVANLGMGPLDLVARLGVYGGAAYGLDKNSFTHRARLETFRARARSGSSNYGTAYLWTAGLMNLLLLFEVWDIGRGRKT